MHVHHAMLQEQARPFTVAPRQYSTSKIDVSESALSQRFVASYVGSVSGNALLGEPRRKAGFGMEDLHDSGPRTRQSIQRSAGRVCSDARRGLAGPRMLVKLQHPEQSLCLLGGSTLYLSTGGWWVELKHPDGCTIHAGV